MGFVIIIFTSALRNVNLITIFMQVRPQSLAASIIL